MHSSHSSETPLQAALTSQRQECIKRRGNSEAAQTERLPVTASCAEQPQGFFFSFHSEDELVESLGCRDLLRHNGEDSLIAHSLHVGLFRRKAVHDTMSCLRCQPRALRSAAVRLAA